MSEHEKMYNKAKAIYESSRDSGSAADMVMFMQDEGRISADDAIVAISRSIPALATFYARETARGRHPDSCFALLEKMLAENHPLDFSRPSP